MRYRYLLLNLPAAAILLTSCALLVWNSCNSGPQLPAGEYIVVEGSTMGTYYRITYADSSGRDFGADIDKLLREINMEISTYIDSSTISRFNKSDEPLELGIRLDGEPASAQNRHFWACYWKGLEVYQKSGGAFDPTVMPLVNYWGFGYTEKRPVTQVDSAAVDSLLRFVGMNKVVLEKGGQTILRKTIPGVQLDFSALGQGYGVDAVAEFLEGRNIRNYLVDIGGEQRAKGRSSRGEVWRIGLSRPSEDALKEEIIYTFPLDDMSVNTSGNYRNYYDVEGAKYSHTINPVTGYPERSPLLSATIFAKDCLTADAYATTCMVLGFEKAREFILTQPGVEAVFVIGREDGSMSIDHTPGLNKYFK